MSIFVVKSVDNGGALINGSNIITTSSFLLTILMIAAIFVRIKIKDKLINILPATLYAILNFIVLYNSLF